MEKVYTIPDEPIECPLCGLDPISAIAAKQRPAVLVHPGWVQCECRGNKPFNVAEELLKREGKSPASQMRGDIYACWLEDVRRPHEPGSSGGSSTREKPINREIRPEQEWAGFRPAELVATERSEGLTEPIKGALPRYFVERLKREASHGTTESRLVRWAISKHLNSVTPEDVSKIQRGKTMKFKYLLNHSQARLWQAKKAELGCSSAQLLAALLIKEWK